MAKKAATTKKKAVAAKKKAAAPKKAVKVRSAPKKTKYLVTGACGFTGLHVCEHLYEHGLDYRATDVPGSNISDLPPGTDFIPADVTKPETLKEIVEGIDIIFHPAAIFDWSTPWERLVAVNVDGTENLCKAAIEAGVKRIVSWSTSGVYGNQEFDTLPITEDFPQAPIEDYSKSKQMQDEIVLSYNGKGGLTTAIIRPGVVYGPRAKYGAAQVFDAFAILPIIPVPMNFKYRFGVIHVRDVAGAGLFVSGKAEAAGQVYGVVDCSGVSIAEFFKLIAKCMGKPVLPLFVPPMLSRNLGLACADVSEWVAKNITKTHPLLERGPIEFFPVDLYVSNQKLLDLGYEYEYPTPERGVEETIAWMRAEGVMNSNIIDLIKKISEKK